MPAENPPERRLIPVGTAEARSFTGNPSIGAFEPNAAQPPPPVAGPGGAPTIMTGAGAGGTGDGSGGSSGGCKCRVAEDGAGPEGWLGGIAMGALALARRRRRAKA